MFAPLAWLLAAYYEAWPSYGLAITALTATLFLAVLPLSIKQARAMGELQRIQPEVRALRQRHGADRHRLHEETMALYRGHGVNPAGGCLPSLLQLPVMIVMYRVIRGLTYHDPRTGDLAPRYLDHGTALYRSLQHHGGKMMSWGIDLSTSAVAPHGSLLRALPFFALGALVVATSFWQQHVARRRVALQREDAVQAGNSIVRFVPVLTGVFALTMPAGVALYYLVSNLLRVGQQHLFARLHHPAPTLDPSTT